MSEDLEKTKDGCFIALLMLILMPFSMMYNAYALQLGFKWILCDAFNIGLPSLVSLMALNCTISFFVKKSDIDKDSTTSWERFGKCIATSIVNPTFYILTIFILSKFI